MNDRELLELAAKALGTELLLMGSRWNPLEDDGDALRLAVTLCMPIEHGGDYAVAYAGKSVMSKQFDEFHGADACAATRRAIVRAAAEIGKQA